MLYFDKDSSNVSFHWGAGGWPPSISEGLTAYSGVLLTPDPLSENWIRLGALRCL